MAINSADVNEKLTLQEAYSLMNGDRQQDIPFLVWLFENPDSPLRFPGQISLRDHDYLHIIFGCDRSPDHEAWLVGFTIGNDLYCHRFHLLFFKFVARYLYPKNYRFSRSTIESFARGVKAGRKAPYKQIHQFDFERLKDKNIEQLRKIFAVDIESITIRRNQ
jgi:ubiquinone biosynthesis protein Coq4